MNQTLDQIAEKCDGDIVYSMNLKQRKLVARLQRDFDSSENERIEWVKRGETAERELAEAKNESELNRQALQMNLMVASRVEAERDQLKALCEELANCMIGKLHPRCSCKLCKDARLALTHYEQWKKGTK